MISDRLAEILAHKKTEIARLEPHAELLRKTAIKRNDFRPFRNRLQLVGGMGLIAEVKKASPSAGVIAENFNPVGQAREYSRAGAHCLSILTDEKFFQGSLAYLKHVREQVDLPLLRKDFILSPLQVYEAVVAGADAILLIVAAFEDDEPLRELYDLAKTLQLDVLVEVHDLPEMDRALDLGADMIGINNRNLRSFEVSLQTTADLSEEIPSDVLAVSESGIKTREDVLYCQQHAINAILVGETLMRAPNIPAKVAELLGLPIG